MGESVQLSIMIRCEMTVIATRELFLDDKVIVMEVFQPTPKGSDGDFTCHYTVHFPDEPLTGHGFGVDSVAALYDALIHCHICLLVRPEYRAGRLKWLSNDGQLALPLPPGDTPQQYSKL